MKKRCYWAVTQVSVLTVPWTQEWLPGRCAFVIARNARRRHLFGAAALNESRPLVCFRARSRQLNVAVSLAELFFVDLSDARPRQLLDKMNFVGDSNF
jgi:hypothetical protein